MRISVLKSREPFNEILFKTLKNTFGAQIKSAEIFYVKRFSLQYFKYFRYIWFGNSYLNFYAAIQSNSSLFEVLIKEYSHSRNKLLRLFQWVYVHLMITKVGRILFASEHIAIITESKFLKDTIILGGNHRIRFLRPTTNTTQIILKNGFRKEWITNELNIRQSMELRNTPKLKNIISDKTSFIEEYKPGIPINRLNSALHQKLKEQACKIIYSDFSQKYSGSNKLSKYITDKADCIRNDYNSGVSSNKDITDFKLLTQVLNEIIALINKCNQQFELSITKSHGDFQDANILLNKNGELIFIDWESADYRWIAYDCLTLILGARSQRDINIEFFKGQIQKSETITGILRNEKFTLELSYLVFCLEELHYQVLNLCEPVFYKPGYLLNEYLSKMLRNVVSLKL